jgi:tetratricopeptide (TPR) repeat protein
MGKLVIKRKGKSITRINSEIDAELNYALDCMEKGNYKEGERLAIELMQKYPKIASTYQIYASVKALLNENEEVITYCDKTLALLPQAAEPWYLKATAYSNLGKDVEAYICLKKFVARADRVDNADVEEAERFLRKTEAFLQVSMNLTLDKFIQLGLIFNKAMDAVEKNQWNTALKFFKRALKVDLNNLPTVMNIGICLAVLGKRNEAFSAFDKVLEIDPQYLPAIQKKGSLLEMKEGERLDFSAHDLEKLNKVAHIEELIAKGVIDEEDLVVDEDKE